MKVRNSTWIISDTHFGHKNIIQFQQRPESHEVIMLDEWIKRVPDDWTILHLGDVFLGKQGNPERWARVISRLPGRKFLILGNHDKARRELYTDLAGFTIIEPFVHRGVAFSHRPITPEYPMQAPAPWHTNVHGHIHGNTLEASAALHGEKGPIPNKLYVNACVEVRGFAPVQLGQLAKLDDL